MLRIGTITEVNQLNTIFDNIGSNITDQKLIIVEGFDGVGKGRVVKELVRAFGLKVYRPDYEYWNQYLDRSQRWMIFRSAWDFLQNMDVKSPLILDRGMLSGAVYNRDSDLMKQYSDLLADQSVMHILVITDQDSYLNMQRVRQGPMVDSESWESCKSHTDLFKFVLNDSRLSYVEFKNNFDHSIGSIVHGYCGGCDNFTTLRQEYDSEVIIGRCAKFNSEVKENDVRCEFYQEGDTHAAK